MKSNSWVSVLGKPEIAVIHTTGIERYHVLMLVRMILLSRRVKELDTTMMIPAFLAVIEHRGC